jgi:hypothetical protein
MGRLFYLILLFAQKMGTARVFLPKKWAFCPSLSLLCFPETWLGGFCRVKDGSGIICAFSWQGVHNTAREMYKLFMN